MMETEIEILRLNINNTYIGCIFDEINRVISDVSGISDNETGAFNEDKNLYKLGELLSIPGKVDYNTLLVIGSNMKEHIFVAVPAIIDVLKVTLSEVLVVPEYIRKKQDPFVVWGFVDHHGKMIKLITFAHFLNVKYKDG